MTARSVRHTPSRFTASVRSTCSTDSLARAPEKAMPALAIATSIPPKRSTVPSTARSSAAEVGHVGLEAGRALAEPRRVLLEPLRLEPDERDVRAPRVQALGGAGADAACGARDEDGLPALRRYGMARRLPW